MTIFYSVMRAATKGVIDELECDEPRHGGKYVSFSANRWSSYLIGTDVFRTREEAVREARVRVEKRTTSLRKSLAKVEKIEIN